MRIFWTLTFAAVLSTACGNSSSTTTTTTTSSGSDAAASGDATSTAGDVTGTTATDTVATAGDASGTAADAASGTGDSTTTAPSGKNATMVACIEKACAAEFAACKADAQCAASTKCILACPDCDTKCLGECGKAVGSDNEADKKMNDCVSKDTTCMPAFAMACGM